MMDRYTVTRADLQQDREAILAIWRRNLRVREDAGAKFEWQFTANPYGAGGCWILRDRGVPAGTTAVTMRPFEIQGTATIAAVAGDFAVDVPHRFAQPALMLQRAVLASLCREWPMVYGLPNERAAPILKRVNFAESGEIHRYVKVVRVSRYLERSIRFRGVALALGGIADAAYAALARAGERIGREFSVRVMPEFDARFDELWERCRGVHPVVEPRDSRFLRWRFGQCPLRRYSTLGLLSRDESRLHGYWIYYLDGETMVCADLLAAEPESQLGPVLAAASAHARASRVSSISASFLLPAGMLATFGRFGFRRRTGTSSPTARRKLSGPQRLMVAWAGDGCGGASSPWYFTGADEDNN